MQVQISGHHVDVTDALREYIGKKMTRIDRHFDQVIDVHVVLEVQKQRQKAEGTVHLAGANLHAETEHDDMYAAIDLMVDKLDRQVRKHKEKTTDHHQRDGGIKNQTPD